MKLTKELIEEVRKECPYKRTANYAEVCRHLGYLEAVRAFAEKLEEKK